MNDKKFNIDITDYETPDFTFQLSEKATAKLKKNVLAEIEKIENNTSSDNNKIIAFRRKFISFVVAATLLIASTTAIASITNTRQEAGLVGVTEATSVKNKKDKKDKGKPTENSSQNTTSYYNSTETENYTFPVVKEKKFVELDCDIIKDYTLINKENGWYSFEYRDSAECNKNVDLEVIYCDSPWSRDFVQQAGLTRCSGEKPEYNQFFLEDRKAMYITYPYDGVYTQQLFIQQHGTGYVFTLIAGDGLSKKELIEMGSKIRLKLCDKETASEHIYFSEYLENYLPDKLRPENYSEQIDLDNIAEINQPVLLENCEITVESFTTYDNISRFTVTEQLATESETTAETVPVSQPLGLDPVLLTNLDLFMNSDGTLPYYERKTVVNGDGYMTPETKTVLQSQTKQVFCVVQLKVKNISQNPVKNFNTQLPLTYIYENNHGFYYNSDYFNRPVMEEMCQKNNQPAYYFAEDKNINLEAGEERTIQLGYFADEDLLSELYLSVANNNADSCIKVDISV